MTQGSIPDAPPADHVALFTAFDRFCKLRNTGAAGMRETDAERSARLSGYDKLYREFLQALQNGKLKAIVCHPGTRERMPIPPEAWVTAWFPERLLLTQVISGQEGDDFLAYKDRTPFISEAQFSAIFDPRSRTVTPSLYSRALYPWADCFAAFKKRVEQDGAPTTDGGEPGWRTQADVERWICDWMLKWSGKQPSEAIARRRAKEFRELI